MNVYRADIAGVVVAPNNIEQIFAAVDLAGV